MQQMVRIIEQKMQRGLTQKSEQQKHFEKLLVHIKLNHVMCVGVQDKTVERRDSVSAVKGPIFQFIFFYGKQTNYNCNAKAIHFELTSVIKVCHSQREAYQLPKHIFLKLFSIIRRTCKNLMCRDFRGIREKQKIRTENKKSVNIGT